ncbi:hypothetical protein KJ966_01005 [bacterium]|nr:hypothetical protein [bacterium]
MDSENVTAEWLFTIAKVKEVPLFLREGEDISVKNRFSEGKGLESKTRLNAFFLTVVDQFNGKTAGKIIRWFHQCNVISGLDDSAIMNYTMHLLRDVSMKQAIVQFLKVVGIWDLEATFKKTKLDDVPEVTKNAGYADVKVTNQKKKYNLWHLINLSSQLEKSRNASYSFMGKRLF